jgi:hypothetical protein
MGRCRTGILWALVVGATIASVRRADARIEFPPPPLAHDDRDASRTMAPAVPELDPNDTKWGDEFALPVTDGAIIALTRFRGDLIAGGSFRHIGGVAAQNVARWDGGAWRALGEGISGTVYDLAVHGDSLVVAGSFVYAGAGILANGIAVWDGAAWSPLEERSTRCRS